MRTSRAALAGILATVMVAVAPGPVGPVARAQPAEPEPAPHEAPGWFNDAKLGFFVHWGPYSVPAYAPKTGGARDGSFRYAEWYWYEMNHPGSATYEHHAAKYGTDFPYDRFIEQWKPDRFDPEEWLDLFVDGGAKYFVLTSKHHDGVALWDSETTGRDTVELGPRRDLVSELFTAAEKYPLKKGLYYSLAEWYHPKGGWVPPRGHSLEEGPANPYTGEPVPYTGYTPVDDDVMDHQYPQMMELVEKFDPDIMWCDIGIHVPNNSEAFVDHYFDQAANRPQPKDVTVNDRCGNEHADFTTPEYETQADIEPAKWEATRGIGHSFGYNAEEAPEDYLSSEDLVESFVDIVSKNGNLLLNIGPKADGSIPEIQAERVRELGAWLKINGEAIYGSTYWAHAEDEHSNVPVRYTERDGNLYVTAFAWPGEELTLSGDLPLAASSQVTLLGSDGESLAWQRADGRVRITMPERGESATKSRYAYTFKIATPGLEAPLHTGLDLPGQPEPGEPIPATVTITNPGRHVAPPTRVRLTAPDGWSVEPARAHQPPLRPGETRTMTFTVTPPEDAPPAHYRLTADVTAGHVTYQPADSILLSDLVRVVKPEKLTALTIAGAGVRPYVDRNWALTELPDELTGAVLVPGANDDKRIQPGPMSVVDGRARVAGGDVTLAKTGQEWTDYDVELTVRPTTRGAGWVFRAPDRRNGYMWQLYPGTGLTPHLLRDGTFTRLAGTIPLDVVAGRDYRVRMELRGSLIRTFVDGQLVDEREDGTFAAGTVGFREAANETAEFDDVRVTDPGGQVLLADDFSAGTGQWDNDAFADYLVLDLRRDATVYVAFDERGAPERADWWPDWLAELGFERTGLTVGTDDPGGSRLVVHRAELPAGRIALGPNGATSGSSSSYVTFVTEP
ncbi:alpha-L-fucosidase [Prauserella endophytica]|uniref:alpha-L-fucosidase n=1 Tax=Prauserella endophytica TaxID=1592324 RepID=UPI0013054685|nr:alpha-L-fucosidase [Prauserella endophytica]